MKKLLITGMVIFTIGLISSAQAGSIVLDASLSARCNDQSGSSHHMGKNIAGEYGGTPTFYDSSRMKPLAENLKRVVQGDTIQITRSRADIVARRALNFTTEYTVVKSSNPNDPHLTIQVKPYGGDRVRSLAFNDWKQLILNDRGVNFHLHCI